MLTYQKLITLPSFRERYEYALEADWLGPNKPVFEMQRFVNQRFYMSKEWRSLRDYITVRDNGCDLAMPGYPVGDRAVIHHLNPVTLEMIKDKDPAILDPDNLVLMSFSTHEALHHGDRRIIPKEWVPRRPGDQCPWRE